MMASRFALLLLLTCTAASAAERFGVVVGANVGSKTRARLWFAERDAERFAATLRELGDFDGAHVRVLAAPTALEVREAIAQTERAVLRARAAGSHALFVFYYSGHAAAGALELGEERFDFTELKRVVERSAADVKVAIVDACESGGLTQVKGARPSAVEFVLPTEEATQGVAYLASTAVGEVAQESAAIGGSFFTFHLEAALRGAGDANGDGRVSLTEAFNYTASRTVTGTSTTVAGSQHPTYNFRMAGRGDVVLSDLRRAQARLALPEPTEASWTVSQGGRLVAEAPGGLVLGLPAGDYRVERRLAGAVAGADVHLEQGELQAVGALTETRAEARNKGGDAPRLTALSVGASLDAPVVRGQQLPLGVRLGVRRAIGRMGLRGELGYTDGGGALGTGQSLRVQSVTAEVGGVYRLFEALVWLDVGAALGATAHVEYVGQGNHWGLSGTAGATAAIGLNFGALGPQLSLVGGARLLRLDDTLVMRPYLSASLGLVVAL